MRKKLLSGTLFLLLYFCVVGAANALIIDIDAVANNTYNPSGNTIDIWLTAGTYEVTPVGVADGGAYNAWDAWGSGRTWVNSYEYSSTEFGTQGFWDGIKYATALEALNNAIVSSFTLTSDGYVSFYNSDPGYGDNLGGISLSVIQKNTQVPEPSTMLLLGTGLAVFAGATRRKLKK